MSIGYQLFGIPIPNRYQLGIWYFSPNVFRILLILSLLGILKRQVVRACALTVPLLCDVYEAVNSVKSCNFPRIPFGSVSVSNVFGIVLVLSILTNV